MSSVPYRTFGQWIIVNIKDIPETYLDIEFKRFPGEHMHILELFDYNSLNVKLFFKYCNSLTECVNRILTGIRYPLDYRGRPNDVVVYKAHKYFLWKYLVDLENPGDYWKRASETVRDGYGDCEDTSTLTHTLFLMKGIDSFWMIGAVYLEDKLLGGHAWVIADVDGKYRLIETTLERPVPDIRVFPPVDISQTEYRIGKLRYVAFYAIHNMDELWINRKIAETTPGIVVSESYLIIRARLISLLEGVPEREVKVRKRELDVIRCEFELYT